MPVNDRYPLDETSLALCRTPPRTDEPQGLRRVRDARRRQRQRRGRHASWRTVLGRDAFKVNLIPYNPIPAGGGFDGSSRDTIAAFKHELDRARIPATVRLTRGRDIAAACGQLATAPRSRARARAV